MIPLSALAELPQDLALLASVVSKVKLAMPLIAKNIVDIRQAIADEKNPAALLVDLETLMTDVNADFNALASVLPPPVK